MQEEFDLAFLWASFCIVDLALKRMERYMKIKTDESLMRVARSRVLITPSAKSPRLWCWALRGVLPLQEGLPNPLSLQPGWQDWIPRKAVDSQQEADTGNKPGDSLTVKEGEQPFTFWDSSPRKVAHFMAPVNTGWWTGPKEKDRHWECRPRTQNTGAVLDVSICSVALREAKRQYFWFSWAHFW